MCTGLPAGQQTPGKGAERSGSQGSSASLAPWLCHSRIAQLACVPTLLLRLSCLTLDNIHTICVTHFAHLQNEGNSVRRKW